MAKSAYVSFRAGDLEDALKERDRDDSLGLTVKRDSDRYYAVLRDELATIDLDCDEATMLCASLEGEEIRGPRYRTLLWASVDPAEFRDWPQGIPIRDIPKGRKQRQEQLVAKLQKLTPGQAMALIDAVERVQRQPNAEQIVRQFYDFEPRDHIEVVKSLVRVGLLRKRWIEDAEERVKEWEEQEWAQVEKDRAEELRERTKAADAAEK